MAEIIDLVPNNTEIDGFDKPSTPKAKEDMLHRREVKRRLEDYLEAQQLKRAMGGDDFFA
ncbi:hypothetical protein Q4601_16075 [Shewanella sp. 1_MG-2023]|uniref:PA3496 family putative envelope integrity protein n=1 Tax=unclassified Shewanella TaxID=196818 RepID=UPI000C84443F|nr:MULTISPECIES: hypothetical protein [unclassified Shewanella]MCC4833153.1 hypothetical protein [Shewanella sp. 10N.7]MDO6611286.1 hypothetical protein [Shewanella sp. 7_MG-2023]MDO6771141.1 hypothetical protein [Shewanella sp. 2_MG-2023]MDO6795822.1 hypothetical protein [Shewanella sp. 1_MG-2023]PMG73492.1 hypothetical protein BCU84_19210 [Shewanella sp. 10N.286.51.B7]